MKYLLPLLAVVLPLASLSCGTESIWVKAADPIRLDKDTMVSGDVYKGGFWRHSSTPLLAPAGSYVSQPATRPSPK